MLFEGSQQHWGVRNSELEYRLLLGCVTLASSLGVSASNHLTGLLGHRSDLWQDLMNCQQLLVNEK